MRLENMFYGKSPERKGQVNAKSIEMDGAV